MTPYLSVIVPAYNEQERLPKTLEDIFRTLDERDFVAEVIVVDDGSKDATADRVETFKEDNDRSNLRLIRCNENGGKGVAVRTGVLASRGEIILFMDADNSVSLDHFDVVQKMLDQGADTVIGSRYLDKSDMSEGQPLYRVLWSRTANWFVQRALLDGIVDTQCGFKAFRAEAARRAFEQLTIPGWGFDLEVLTLLDRMGYSIVEIPVKFLDDRRSKINPLTDAWRVVRDFLKVQSNIVRRKYNFSNSTVAPPTC